jgi:sulfite exporter TauE/SafE
VKADVNYNTGTAEITYDPDIISLKDIAQVIRKLDYEVLSDEAKKPKPLLAAGILVILLAGFMLARHFGLLNILNLFPTAETNMGYGMLFVIGLLTSVHCVAMCGGINLSQCIPQAAKTDEGGSKAAALRPSLLYNLGRVISYTIIGLLVGALGSVITFSSTVQGALKLIAGLFMVFMGLNMLGLFPSLRKFTPRMPKAFARKIDAQKAKSNSPFIIGLLNGLMPCGPLQAMQIYALSTGSAAKGALSMLLFSLGTVPLMFGLGALSSVLSKKFTHKVMLVGSVLVVVLGFSMFSQGWSLSGLSLKNLLPSVPSQAANKNPGDTGAILQDGFQIVHSTLSSGNYPAITVQAGIPVRWIIDAPEGSINGCNNKLLISAYHIQHQFKTGENIIEFTPEKIGTIPYSCWMGMIRSSITVVAAGNQASNAAQPSEPLPADTPEIADIYPEMECCA